MHLKAVLRLVMFCLPLPALALPPSIAEGDPDKLRLAQSELIFIATHIRTLYQGTSGFSSETHTDMTCDLAARGVFPAAMLTSPQCLPDRPETYPISPWGSPVTIYAPWADDYPGQDKRRFQVDFQLYGTTPNPCYGLIAYSLQTKQDTGLVKIWTAGGPPIDPSDGPDGAANCEDAGFDFVLPQNDNLVARPHQAA